MTSRIYCLLLISLLLCLCTTNRLTAQNITGNDTAVLQQYSQLNNVAETDTDTSVWLIKIKSGKQDLFRKIVGVSNKRQISKDWCIVKKNTLVSFDSSLVAARYKANYLWKLSPLLLHLRSTLDTARNFTFIISTEDSALFASHVASIGKFVSVLYNYNNTTIQLKTTLSVVLQKLLHYSDITFIDVKNESPKEEMVINDYDNSVNAIDLFFSKYPGINGDGLFASIKENLFDTLDIDFKNRYQLTSNISSSTTTHATTMATLIGGGGNSFHSGKGIAWGSHLSSSDFADLLPDSDSSYRQYKTSVQNHSYGTRVENFYGADAVAFDQALINNPHLVYVFSAGNSGTLSDSSGQYKNMAGFANLTGSFKQAKNLITVGSVDSFYHIPSASSKGPAYDGRIKPELVAYGNDGSSGAAAITSGTALVMQSAYAKLHHDSLPDNALVKAALINSADDAFNEGPDFYSGYGNVNTYKAVRDISSGNLFMGNAKPNKIDSFSIVIPDNIKQLKVTLVWNDMPAQANAFTALVNDLDLSLKNKSTNEVWLPWVLNSSADSTLLLSAPQRKRDSLNVVEQVTIPQPAKGDYSVYVKGYNVTTLSQPYFVVYEMDTVNQFSFISPSAADHFTSGGKGIIRWNDSYNNAIGKLEYSTDRGSGWLLINNAVPLSNKYYQWQVPDTSAVAMMRMTIGNDVYISDTFDFSRQLLPQVVINCSDSAVIKWSGIKGVAQYNVFDLGETYLRDYKLTSDTSIVIKNSASPYVAIAPVFDNGRTGLNSYTFNYNNQGAGCYINNFLANLTIDNQAQLLLTLGTTSGVDSVQFQQLNRNSWQTLTVVQPVTNVELTYLSSLMNGNNTFRAVVWIKGNSITSDPASILYFKNADFIAKPNPLPQGQSLSFLSSTLVTGTVVVYDVWGRKLIEQEVNNAQNLIATNILARGIYFIVVYDEKQQVFKSKLVIE